jgi:lipopolysaccharide/colanic/teichoic acid biosynthesis glycosyltransferase
MSEPSCNACNETSYRMRYSRSSVKVEWYSTSATRLQETIERRALRLTGRQVQLRSNGSTDGPRGSSCEYDFRVPRWKRALDVILILVASPVLIPIMFGIAVLIKLSSAGPLLFRQERIGYLGRKFICFKFRSMVVGADESLHADHCGRLMELSVPMVKMYQNGDPRLIPGGRLLRASGLDELPQILNVLRGEMSLVGPRPCLSYEGEKYLPWQKERFNTLPGLTGLWQVSGKNKTTFEEMMHLDIHYVRNKSLSSDLRIMFATVSVVVTQILETTKDAIAGQFLSASAAER